MSRSFLVLTLTALAVMTPCAAPFAEDRAPEARWPGWRGHGQGRVAAARIPLEWSETKNILWKAPISGRGHSSPIVWDGRIFLTTAIEGDVVPGVKRMRHVQPDGTEFRHPEAVGDDRRHKFALVSVDSSSGRVLWERVLWEGVPSDSRHRKGSFASPTPGHRRRARLCVLRHGGPLRLRLRRPAPVDIRPGDGREFQRRRRHLPDPLW